MMTVDVQRLKITDHLTIFCKIQRGEITLQIWYFYAFFVRNWRKRGVFEATVRCL